MSIKEAVFDICSVSPSSRKNKKAFPIIFYEANRSSSRNYRLKKINHLTLIARGNGDNLITIYHY